MAMDPIAAALQALQPQLSGPQSPIPPIGAAVGGGVPMVSPNPNITQPIMPPLGPAGIPQAGGAEANKANWTGFFDRLKKDPNFRTAIIQAGATMMQPGGMTGDLGMIGQGLSVGNQTLNQLNQASRQEQRVNEDREAERAFREESLQQGRQRLDLTGQQIEQTGDLTREQMALREQLFYSDAEIRKRGQEIQTALGALNAAYRGDELNLAREQMSLRGSLDYLRILEDRHFREQELQQVKAGRSTGQERVIKDLQTALLNTNTTGRYAGDGGEDVALLDAYKMTLYGKIDSPEAMQERLFTELVKQWASDPVNIGQSLDVGTMQSLRETAKVAVDGMPGFRPESETPAAVATPEAEAPPRPINSGDVYETKEGGQITIIGDQKLVGGRWKVKNALGDVKILTEAQINGLRK